MSEISNEKKKRGGGGLGQGRKKVKDVKPKTFFLDANVAKIINNFTLENGFKRGTMIEFVEVAILGLHKEIYPEDFENISLINLDNRKSKLKEILNGRKILRTKF